MRAGKPRNPARIDRMIEKLRLLWHKHPDLRLGQLIVNISGLPDPFYVEDDRMEEKIEEDWLSAGKP